MDKSSPEIPCILHLLDLIGTIDSLRKHPVIDILHIANSHSDLCWKAVSHSFNRQKADAPNTIAVNMFLAHNDQIIKLADLIPGKETVIDQLSQRSREASAYLDPAYVRPVDSTIQQAEAGQPAGRRTIQFDGI